MSVWSVIFNPMMKSSAAWSVRVREFANDNDVRAYAKSAEYVAKFAAVITVLWSGVTYISNIPEQREAANRAAWQVLNLSYAHPGSGGRSGALEALARGHQILDGVNVWLAYLSRLRLDGASVRNADFRQTILTGASFERTDATGTRFQYANISGASFAGAYLDGADFRSVSAIKDDRFPKRLSFDSAHLNQSKFNGATLANPRFFMVASRDGDYEKVHFTGADFTLALLFGAVFTNSTLIDVNFQKACLLRANFSNTVLKNVNFKSALVFHANFLGARFIGSSLHSLVNAEGVLSTKLSPQDAAYVNRAITSSDRHDEEKDEYKMISDDPDQCDGWRQGVLADENPYFY